MRRWVAVLWHASFSLLAAGLYFAFVLPRWWELMGDTPHTLGTVFRIVAGALIGLAALPVVFTLLKTRRPEFNTPQLALTLRTWSIVLHVLAGVLIIGTAISEIWLSLDAAGPWLFGIYGGAAAIALLGVFTFYLAYVAEMPPPPPKPLKPKTDKQRRGRRKKADDEVADDEVAPDEAEDSQEAEDGVGGRRRRGIADRGTCPGHRRGRRAGDRGRGGDVGRRQRRVDERQATQSPPVSGRRADPPSTSTLARWRRRRRLRIRTSGTMGTWTEISSVAR